MDDKTDKFKKTSQDNIPEITVEKACNLLMACPQIFLTSAKMPPLKVWRRCLLLSDILRNIIVLHGRNLLSSKPGSLMEKYVLPKNLQIEASDINWLNSVLNENPVYIFRAGVSLLGDDSFWWKPIEEENIDE
ncbi:hypothetical protein [Okeania sp. SIO2B3]|uniref:hypothetical protein n=1 Tax=Okeania sp. SIO2B3 TaxID=2607784 RepID=UPI0013C0100A|nr:hypothetical protein [Okeania sp. SIO2B3]NET44866.1 hypothetical protein [Okeania sp. SIO2B3]